MNLFWFIICFIHPSISSARILDHHQWPSHHMTTHHHPITFFMHDSLNINTAVSANHYSSSTPITTRSSPSSLSSSSSTVLQTDHQTLDTSSTGWIMSFPAGAIATLQGLTLGTVTAIDETLMAGYPLLNGFSQLIGKAQGVYLSSSSSPSDEDHGSTNGHVMMIAMNLLFANGDFKDGLKLFGVVNLQQPDLHHHHHEEPHIAVIGGTGKYVGANGYATVKAVTVNMDNNDGHEIDGIIKNFLQFTIYLS